MAAAGRWKINDSKLVLVDVNVAHRYRVCSSDDSTGKTVELSVDGKVNGAPLKAGECRDVKGKKIEIGQSGGNNSMGTYDNLD